MKKTIFAALLTAIFVSPAFAQSHVGTEGAQPAKLVEPGSVVEASKTEKHAAEHHKKAEKKHHEKKQHEKKAEKAEHKAE